MTAAYFRRIHKETAALVILLVLTTCSFLSAQKQAEVCISGSNNNLNVSQIILDNYAMGLKSDNRGLKESCIYLVGFYGIDGLVEP